MMGKTFLQRVTGGMVAGTGKGLARFATVFSAYTMFPGIIFAFRELQQFTVENTITYD